MRPASPSWRVVILAAVVVATLILFGVVAVGSRAEAGLPFDEPVLAWFGEHQVQVATRLALTLDLLGISYLLLPAAALLAIVLLETGRRYAAGFLIACTYGAVGLNLVAKAYFRRARPELGEQLTPATNASFPSGHAMGSLAFALALTVIATRLWPRHRVSITVALVSFAVAVGVARIYLQVHYPSDVLAAWALSAAWVAVLTVWYPPRLDGPR